MTECDEQVFDIFIIGGGINGCGIARDASGRGYKVALAEMNDLASATSSSSTKLFHGGLRYLEFFEFRLVREALIEREILLRAMPHISWPMRFVLPVHKDMRFESTTPTSKLLTRFMPWLKGQRPAWLIRLGLFLYDNLGGRKILPGTKVLDLKIDPAGKPLDDKFERAFEYSDCWVEDSRLVILNAQDAKMRGARILPHHKVISATQSGGQWLIETENQSGQHNQYKAKMIVNAGGPWVSDIVQTKLRQNRQNSIRLVRGSHIVTKKLYDHDKCYFFQGSDGRIIFTIPYEEDFTLIGTTDRDHEDASEMPICSDEEKQYLMHFANQYFASELVEDDIVWTYSGVRPLYDDGASSATAATRDYVLKLERENGAPILNIFGGKITTYRRLAESALIEIDSALSRITKQWTSEASLPGGDIELNQITNLRQELSIKLSFLDKFTVRRLVRQYGTQVRDIFGAIGSVDDLGENFGSGITGHELNWAIENEWVTCAEDFIWRRSKLGLRLTADQVAAIDKYIQENKCLA